MNSKFIIKICLKSPESVIFAELIWRKKDIIIMRNAIYEQNESVVLLSLSINLSYIKSITTVSDEEFTKYKKTIMTAPGNDGKFNECACKEVTDEIKCINNQSDVYKPNTTASVNLHEEIKHVDNTKNFEEELKHDILPSSAVNTISKSNVGSTIKTSESISNGIQFQASPIAPQIGNSGITEKSEPAERKKSAPVEKIYSTEDNKITPSKRLNSPVKKTSISEVNENSPKIDTHVSTKKLYQANDPTSSDTKGSKVNVPQKENNWKNKKEDKHGWSKSQSPASLTKTFDKSNRPDTKKYQGNSRPETSGNVTITTNRNITLTYKGKKYADLPSFMDSLRKNIDNFQDSTEDWGTKDEISVVDKGKKIFIGGKSKYYNRKYY